MNYLRRCAGFGGMFDHLRLHVVHDEIKMWRGTDRRMVYEDERSIVDSVGPVLAGGVEIVVAVVVRRQRERWKLTAETRQELKMTLYDTESATCRSPRISRHHGKRELTCNSPNNSNQMTMDMSTFKSRPESPHRVPYVVCTVSMLSHPAQYGDGEVRKKGIFGHSRHSRSSLCLDRPFDASLTYHNSYVY